MTNIIGLVLCGGKSSRMGTDKGMIKKEGITWARLAFNKLNSLAIPVVVSVNDSQVLEYEKIFSDNLLITDLVDIGGPFKGILSADHKFPQCDLFVLACDMVDVNFQLLAELKEVYELRKRQLRFFCL